MRPELDSKRIVFRAFVILLCLALGVSLFLATTIEENQPEGFIPAPPTALAEATPTATGTPTQTPAPSVTPTPTVPNSIVYSVSPRFNDVGWVQADIDENFFGESYLYAGVRDGILHHGAMQFDLSFIPIGASIINAQLELTGLDESGLEQQNLFALYILDTEIERGWAQHGYRQIHEAETSEIVLPILEPVDLGDGVINRFIFEADIRSVLEERLTPGSISFRLSSLTADQEGWFAWDTGFGPQSQAQPPVLKLAVLLPQIAPREARGTTVSRRDTPTPSPTATGILITSTPTPANALTLVAVQQTAMMSLELTGTPTPVPENWVTPLIITATPTPLNAATVAFQQTAQAVVATVFGTPTSLPINFVTATPTVPTATPPFVMITHTPTPETVETAVYLSLRETAIAQQFGPRRPVPPNWVTPFAVTSTPTPLNAATIQYWEAVYITTGTPTPLPGNAVTATPTSVYVLLQGQLLRQVSPTPPATATPGTIPAQLLGKIIFKSDRALQDAQRASLLPTEQYRFDENGPFDLYVINPDGTGLALLTDSWPYDVAKVADTYSSDGRYQVYTSDMARYRNVESTDASGLSVIEAVRDDIPAIHWYDYHYNVQDLATSFGAGISYGGVWSPIREQIAFVSTESGNDEVWVVNRDGTDLRQLTRDPYHWWDKHPSWSPNGEEIVFWSNRTGLAQIWIMDREGSPGSLRSLSLTGYNDWDPVWVKYQNIPFWSRYIGDDTPPQPEN